MGQPYIGQIIAVGFNFTPIGWLACDGSLYAISQYEALYTLIGTAYGGNGTSTFAVPDLRGRSPLCIGQGNGLPAYALAQQAGTETVSLTANQVGAHPHRLQSSSKTGTAITPGTGMALAVNGETTVNVFGPSPAATSLAPAAISSSSGGMPHENRQPFLTINHIICAEGIYPTRT